MWIRNTSKYPTDEVRKLVKLGCEGIDMRYVCVNVKGGKLARGRAYDDIPIESNAPKTARYLITLSVPTPFTREVAEPRLKRVETMTVEDWKEWLVWVAAHEAKHIEQFKENLICSEVRASTYANHRLTTYRDGYWINS